jgi:predicted nucleic acid-binding protein
MEWVRKLYGTIVGLDTAPLIYFVELHPKYILLLDPFFVAVDRGDIQVVTSTLTLTEVLVHPFKRGDQGVADEYSRLLLNSNHLSSLPVSARIAEEAARIRAAHGTKTPDSIQLATARIGNATTFLTNDGKLASIPGVNVIILENTLPSP